LTIRTDDRFAYAAGSALASHTRDIVLLMRPNGEIAFANEAASVVYGYPAETLIGMNVRDLRAPSTRPLVETQMATAAQEGVLFETCHVRRDGSQFPVEVSSRGVEIDGEHLVLSVVRDISRRHESQRASAELLVELESANRQLEGLLRIVSSAVGRLDLDHLLSEVLTVLRDVMDADAAVFFVLDGASWRLRTQAGYPGDELDGFTMGQDEGFASRVAAAGETLWIADVSSAEWTMSEHHRYGVRAMLGVPLFLEGGLFGVVECTWSSERLVSDSERVMLQVAADRIMAAVLGAQRYERTLRAQRFEASLSEIAAVLNSSHEFETPIVLALQMASEALGADVAAFGSYRAGVYEIQHAVGAERQAIKMPGHPADAREVGVVSISEDSEPSDAARAVLGALGLSHAAIVPVTVGGVWDGALLIGRSRHEPFDEAELDFVRRFSATVAIAASNVAEYEAEHLIAETLQEALLTLDTGDAALRIGHLYRSATLATRVGGDFYDIFPMADGRVGVLIGDVSGKGLDAAVLTSFVKNTIRAFAHSESSPARIIQQANEVLAAAAHLPDFASVVLLVVDPGAASLAYCCAGHPPAIITHPEAAAEYLSNASPVIGAFSGLEYIETTVAVTSDDVVVLYTDGVTEARGADGGFFGDERLLLTIEAAAEKTPERLPELIHDAVMAYTSGRLSDDIAILCFSLA